MDVDAVDGQLGTGGGVDINKEGIHGRDERPPGTEALQLIGGWCDRNHAEAGPQKCGL